MGIIIPVVNISALVEFLQGKSSNHFWHRASSCGQYEKLHQMDLSCYLHYNHDCGTVSSCSLILVYIWVNFKLFYTAGWCGQVIADILCQEFTCVCVFACTHCTTQDLKTWNLKWKMRPHYMSNNIRQSVNIYVHVDKRMFRGHIIIPNPKFIDHNFVNRLKR